MMNLKTNTITLFVTKGCEACNIAKNLLNTSIEKSKKSIELEVYDITDDKPLSNIAKLYLIDDFPTAIFVKNGMVVHKVIGTSTVDELVKNINEIF